MDVIDKKMLELKKLRASYNSVNTALYRAKSVKHMLGQLDPNYPQDYIDLRVSNHDKNGDWPASEYITIKPTDAEFAMLNTMVDRRIKELEDELREIENLV